MVTERLATGASKDSARHPVVAFFTELGDRIAAQLGPEPASAIEHLEAIAVRELHAANPSAQIGFDAIIDYVLGANTVCAQADLDAKFAEPPVSLYHGGTFDISALVWLDGTTSIHQHAFSGAFHVLAGSSIHSQYRFHADDPAQTGVRALTGRLELCGLEVLRAGDTRVIRRGPSLIHALFHMIRPSITIVVRTICDKPDAGPQYDYRWPGVAYDPFQRHAPTIRRLQYLRMLRQLDAKTYPRYLVRCLEQADLFLAYQLISEEALLDGDLARVQSLVQQCQQLDAAAKAKVLAAAHNDVISRALIDMRRLLHAPDHRFCLALLLNVFERAALLDIVAREHGSDDPIATVLGWIREMTGQTEHFPNLLKLDFNATVMEVLELMWRGHGEQAVIEHLVARHGAAALAGQIESLRRLFVALRDCPLFYQVFADLR